LLRGNLNTNSPNSFAKIQYYCTNCGQHFSSIKNDPSSTHSKCPHCSSVAYQVYLKDSTTTICNQCSTYIMTQDQQTSTGAYYYMRNSEGKVFICNTGLTRNIVALKLKLELVMIFLLWVQFSLNYSRRFGFFSIHFFFLLSQNSMRSLIYCKILFLVYKKLNIKKTTVTQYVVLFALKTTRKVKAWSGWHANTVTTKIAWAHGW